MTELRARTNRLRRSVRASQAADLLLSSGDRSRQAPRQHDLQSLVQTSVQTTVHTTDQTPARSRLSAGPSGESPLNDSISDLHQDIIWDNTSPSPHRLGKRGRRVAAGVLNISDIVSRIAPESGRPRVLEPALQQWIGDSATIPCTPELQPPKPKKKSPRPNGVDDLLKLAKQFDFNMLHEVRPGQDLGRDIGQDLDRDLGQNLDQDLDLAGLRNPVQDPDPDWVSDEDLDYLFDGSTQSISGAFSQSLPTPKTPKNREKSLKTQADQSGKACLNLLDAKLAQNTLKRGQPSFSNVPLGQFPPRIQDNTTSDIKAMDKSSSYRCPLKSEQVPTKHFKFKSSNSSKSVEFLAESPAPAVDCGFDDDWGDDALMEDSLLMEMTQNPPRFTSPKCTSTQQNSGKADRTRRTFKLTADDNFYTNFNTKREVDFDIGFGEKSEKVLDQEVRKAKTVQNPQNASQFGKNAKAQQTSASTPFQECSNLSVDANRSITKKPQSFPNPQNDNSRPQQNFPLNFAKNSSAGFQCNNMAEKSPTLVLSGPNDSSAKKFGPRFGGLSTNHAINDTSTTKSEANVDFSKDFSANLQQSFGASIAQTGLNPTVSQDVYPLNGLKTDTKFRNAVSSKDCGTGVQRGVGANDFKDSEVGQTFSSKASFGARSGVLSTNDMKNCTFAAKSRANIGNGNCSSDFGAKSQRGVGANVVNAVPDSKVCQTLSSGIGFKGRAGTFLSNNSKSHSSATRYGQNFPNAADLVGDFAISDVNSVLDFPEEDLDSFFTSEPLWDDNNSDDDLLCELCEDVETEIQRQSTANQMQRAGLWASDKSRIQKMPDHHSSFELGTNGMQRTEQWSHQTQRAAQKPNETSNLNQGTNQTQRMGQWTNQTQRVGQWTNQTQRVGQWSDQAQSRTPAPPQKLVPPTGARDDFTFKKPNPVCPAPAPRVMSKCSAAEIELKKQQAMERRRQRLQVSHQPISSLRASM